MVAHPALKAAFHHTVVDRPDTARELAADRGTTHQPDADEREYPDKDGGIDTRVGSHSSSPWGWNAMSWCDSCG